MNEVVGLYPRDAAYGDGNPQGVVVPNIDGEHREDPAQGSILIEVVVACAKLVEQPRHFPWLQSPLRAIRG